MRPLWEVADLVRAVRRQMRFGELSRAPLRMIRLGCERSAECEWTARFSDVWDTSLQCRERDRNVSQQALRDAIMLRDLLFAALPNVQSAMLRCFHPLATAEQRDPIIAGSITREVPLLFRVSSLVMRAKLYGFQFQLEDGVLQGLDRQEFEGFAVRAIHQIPFHEAAR